MGLPSTYTYTYTYLGCDALHVGAGGEQLGCDCHAADKVEELTLAVAGRTEAHQSARLLASRLGLVPLVRAHGLLLLSGHLLENEGVYMSKSMFSAGCAKSSGDFSTPLSLSTKLRRR